MLSPSIRDDFEFLQHEVDGRLPIYFDNACMTLKPKPVVDAILEYYNTNPVCGGRSIHQWGTWVTMRVTESRERFRDLLNASSENEIVFTKNATEAMNLVAHGIDMKDGDVVVTTDKEHNSNVLPWVEKRALGVKHRAVRFNDETFEFDIESLKEAMSNDVKLVSMVHVSNMDGTSIPAKEIAEIAHDHGALFMLDGAQSAPHHKVDVRDIDVDFFALSVHKMMGPTGVGVLYGKEELLKELKPFIVGGGTVAKATFEEAVYLDPPDKFEAGLQHYAGLTAAGKAVEYLTNLGMENIHEHEVEMNRLATEAVLSIPGSSIVGPEDPERRSGICSFRIDGFDVHEIGMTLEAMGGIMIRTGAHCVHSWFIPHGMNGSARASFYIYNTAEEIKTFADCLSDAFS